ncbi:NAD(P)H-dependent oxidoreductase [Ahrensia sp. 13_GOM-1096m]|uniref:NAD(P)H-dependent oxidoreductase n=1 Tax=Ahrensia sp. 13_GOM-1096m TaxID=1380380 RepID=UPI00047B54D4|nr:NAD(P)H-dependent oxidoreductase [Ahrensia sp. 13_GOM-1096m]
MTTTLIILAHPEVTSFNANWAAASASAAQAQGDDVLWSDLYRMGFDPAERADFYVDHDGPFDPLKAQEQAAEQSKLSPQIAAEIEKIKKADRLIFHFPMWWFGPPAILKGWFDRVLAHGALHNVQERFDNGMCRGKKALFCVTTGSSELESAPHGKEADANMLLWPSAYTLRYCGFDVLKPVFAHRVHGYNRGDRLVELETRLQKTLKAQAELVTNFDTLPMITFNADNDFDENGQLKEGVKSTTPFIRR